MDNKEQIINEYLIGGISFRYLAKKYGISRSTINRWVLEYQGFICMRKSHKESITFLEMNKEPREVLPTEIIELQKQLEQERLHNKSSQAHVGAGLPTCCLYVTTAAIIIHIKNTRSSNPLSFFM